DLHVVAREDHEILRLQIPVRDALRMRRRQAARDLCGVLDRLARRDWTLGESAAEGGALEQLADDVGESAAVGLGRADVVDGHDIRVVELPRGPRLALEALQAVLVRGKCAGEDLYRDVPLEPRVPGAVHLAHPSRSEQELNLIWAQARAWGDGGGHLCLRRPDSG